MQQFDPAVDGREVHIESSRQGLPADAYVDGAPKHVVLLHRQEPIDPVGAGVGLKIPNYEGGQGVRGSGLN